MKILKDNRKTLQVKVAYLNHLDGVSFATILIHKDWLVAKGCGILGAVEFSLKKNLDFQKVIQDYEF